MKEMVTIENVWSRMVMLRGEATLLDRDVAVLYGVKTKEVNQAVRNNPDKFPDGYTFVLTKDESESLRSKISTLEGDGLRSKILTANGGSESLRSKISTANISPKSRVLPKAFTERGLYMLATILKSPVATAATLAIVETFAKVRALKRELIELHTETDRRRKSEMTKRFGETLTDLVMPDAETTETESSLEINFFIGKLKHTVRRVRKAE